MAGLSLEFSMQRLEYQLHSFYKKN